jgi:hypothetical protein
MERFALLAAAIAVISCASVELAYRINRQFVLRGQGSFIDLSHSFKSSDTNYSGSATFNTGGASLDWHVFSNPFLVSGGFISGARRVDVSAHPALNGSITIGGVTYTTSQVGSVSGAIDYGATVPVAALGYDSTYVGRHHWGLRAVFGVEFGQHPPAVSLQAAGPLATNPTVLADVQSEQQTVSHDGGYFSYYPVAQVGVTYRF